MGSWFLHNSQFFADFHKNTKEVPIKISKKKIFFSIEMSKKTKGIFFNAVLSFFYAFKLNLLFCPFFKKA
jgi:hypothetical protein